MLYISASIDKPVDRLPGCNKYVSLSSLVLVVLFSLHNSSSPFCVFPYWPCSLNVYTVRAFVIVCEDRLGQRRLLPLG